MHQTLSLRLVTAPAGFRVVWSPRLVFPGLAEGETLRVHTHAPYARGAIRARDGQILASGPASNREYPQGPAFSDVTGYVKTPAPDQVAARVAKGWPARRPYGQAGLEQSLDGVLGRTARGRSAGGVARPIQHVLAKRAGAKPQDVVTTLRIHAQHDAADALGGSYGGAVVLDPKSGAVQASVGLGMEVLQPPGSSFKTVTAAAALQLEGRDPLHRLSVRALHRAERLEAPQLPQGIVRRVVPAGVRGQLQLGVRAGGRPGRREAAGGDGRQVRLQPQGHDPLSGADEHHPDRRRQMDSDLALGTAGIGQGGVGATLAADGLGRRHDRHPGHLSRALHRALARPDRRSPAR